MTPETILTAAPLPWEAYSGGQRRAILHGAVYEELAADVEEAEAAIRAGRIRLGACHDHGCVGSVAGIYTASMPVLVVSSARHGNRGFCNLYEGESRKRLNYGVYDEDVRRGLDYLAGSLGPLLGAAVRRAGGVPLVPLIRRALHMGDELHSRNTAATLLVGRELFGPLLELAGDGWDEEVRDAIAFLRTADYFFLRLSMAAAKVMADAAHGVAGSSLVTAMTISCREYAIRVSGLGDRWFRGPLPTSRPSCSRASPRTTSSGSAARATSPRPSASAASRRRPPSGCRPTRAAAPRRWSPTTWPCTTSPTASTPSSTSPTWASGGRRRGSTPTGWSPPGWRR
jgi:Protein of unknown function (DUF1116)